MGADSAVISSFEKLATAGKVDYSNQLRLQKEGGDIMTKGITKTADIIAKRIQDDKATEDDKNKKINEETNKRINEGDKKYSKRSEEVYKSLDEDGGIGEWFSDGVYDEINRIQEEEFNPYNTGENTPENTKGKQKAMAAQSQITNQVVNFRGDLMTITDSYRKNLGSQISDAMSEEDRNFIQAIIGEDDNRENVTPRWENKVLYFDVVTPGYVDPISGAQITEDTVRSEKASDLMNIYKEKFVEGETKIMSKLNEAQKWGRNAENQNAEFDLETDAYDIETYLLTDEKSTPAGCADLFQRGGIPGQSTGKIERDTSKWKTGSWAHNLQADPSLDMAVYDAANVVVDTGDGKGGPPDGIVSEAEAKAVMTGDNKDIVISTMVDPNYINPITGKNNYNHEDSIRAYSQYRAEINKQAAEKVRTEQFGEKSDGKGSLNPE